MGTSDAAHELRTRFAGRLLLPGDDAYDLARRAHDPGLDPHPAIVAEAAGADDVVAALRTARHHGLPFAVQATGHGTLRPADGALLLKTSAMDDVRVDPQRQTARVGPGTRWAAVIAAAQRYGLVPLAGSAGDVGVTGYTLGGGLSWLSRRFGFAADSVLSAEVVTADGRLLTVGPDQHADLFWALRGGGGNFGVVTALEFRLYPLTEAYGGTLHFPAERTGDVLAWYRDHAPGLPPELNVVVAVQPGSVAVRGLFLGAPADAERLLHPLRQVAGQPVTGGFERLTAERCFTLGDVAPRQADLYAGLPDEVVKPVLAAVEDGAEPAVAAVEFRHWGGAIADPGDDPGPAGHRDTPYSIVIDAADDALAQVLRQHATGGSFLNFLNDPSRAAAAFTEANLRRLARIKLAYDPDNVFRFNHNINPEGSV
ncbi:FAD-binding oxidoreductase [Dactylosporangium fulvum]|uniref:FAD-binding oxidoreductase n=1 Tax=Dactylosporangium fulvum TaxID=53359 RepID=A0ABY5WA88_9ACTN|nr:FAD-binding oxidoreductase [Dactylosporangium fulvum]UWP86472.1 FAD-binding oxidoreductase [Dactylosporangium fulvum]